jgi:hypothetical protein
VTLLTNPQSRTQGRNEWERRRKRSIRLGEFPPALDTRCTAGAYCLHPLPPEGGELAGAGGVMWKERETTSERASERARGHEDQSGVWHAAGSCRRRRGGS